MELITLILIAIGLSFDTFAVSVSTGLIINNIKFWQASRVAIILTIFQSLMPFLGWITGKQIEQLLSDYDHWIAFGLLAILGLKMIYESFNRKEGKSTFNPLKLTVIIWIAIATSIDALVVGVSFAFINMNIYLAMLIIGFITFLASMLGMLFGKKLGSRLGARMEIIGGLILIGIGLKILLDHVVSI
jgi:manganese efflux pump family protein